MEYILAHFMDGVEYFIHGGPSLHCVEDYSIIFGDIPPHMLDMGDYSIDFWHYYIIYDIFSHYFMMRGRKSIVFVLDHGISS